MPQLAQNRCLITCLLNVYVLNPDSGVFSRSLSRSTNHSSEPLRAHIEQLQASALSIVPSTSNATRPQWQLPWYFICLPERNGVDAEPQAARRRAIGKHVSQMRVANVAQRLHALHAVALVEVIRDDARLERLREARPTRAAVELARRVEQRRVAADAVVTPRREQRAQLRAERPLGALLPGDLIFLGRELRAPFGVVLLDAARRRLVAGASELDDMLPAQLAGRRLSYGAHRLTRPRRTARQLPIRPREVARVAAGIAQQIVLMLGLRLPERAGRLDLRDHATRP